MEKDIILSRGSNKNITTMLMASDDYQKSRNEESVAPKPLKIAVVNEKTSSSDLFSPVIYSNREQRRAYRKHFRNSAEVSECPVCKNTTRLYYVPPIGEADDNIGMVYCEFCGKPVLKISDTKSIGAYNIVKIIGGKEE